LPDGALVVNAGRGRIVDTAALVADVKSGRLRAALDVTDPEPLPADHPLWMLPGVIISPAQRSHCSGHEQPVLSGSSRADRNADCRADADQRGHR
jgi:phosphoglycerate dehydrogenase-like enzyme